MAVSLLLIVSLILFVYIIISNYDVINQYSNWDFSSQKKKKPNKWRRINSLVHRIRTVDEGQEQLNHSREKN